MEIIFDKNGIHYDDKEISYDVFETDNANKELLAIIKRCVDCQEKIEFKCTDDCLPFGKLMKSTLEEEFSPKEEELL